MKAPTVTGEADLKRSGEEEGFRVDTIDRALLRPAIAWADFALKQLEQLEKLEPNWDGEGADPPSSESLLAAKQLLMSLDGSLPKPHIHPTRDGYVQIEWEEGEFYLEVELRSTQEAVIVFQMRGMDTPQELLWRGRRMVAEIAGWLAIWLRPAGRA